MKSLAVIFDIISDDIHRFLNGNFEYGYPNSNALLQLCRKLGSVANC